MTRCGAGHLVFPSMTVDTAQNMLNDPNSSMKDLTLALIVHQMLTTNEMNDMNATSLVILHKALLGMDGANYGASISSTKPNPTKLEMKTCWVEYAKLGLLNGQHDIFTLDRDAAENMTDAVMHGIEIVNEPLKLLNPSNNHKRIFKVIFETGNNRHKPYIANASEVIKSAVNSSVTATNTFFSNNPVTEKMTDEAPKFTGNAHKRKASTDLNPENADQDGQSGQPHNKMSRPAGAAGEPVTLAQLTALLTAQTSQITGRINDVDSKVDNLTGDLKGAIGRITENEEKIRNNFRQQQEDKEKLEERLTEAESILKSKNLDDVQNKLADLSRLVGLGELTDEMIMTGWAMHISEKCIYLGRVAEFIQLAKFRVDIIANIYLIKKEGEETKPDLEKIGQLFGKGLKKDKVEFKMARFIKKSKSKKFSLVGAISDSEAGKGSELLQALLKTRSEWAKGEVGISRQIPEEYNYLAVWTLWREKKIIDSTDVTIGGFISLNILDANKTKMVMVNPKAIANLKMEQATIENLVLIAHGTHFACEGRCVRIPEKFQPTPEQVAKYKSFTWSKKEDGKVPWGAVNAGEKGSGAW